MDDLAQKISELLGSPDGLQKLQAAASSLGMLTGNKTDTPPSAEPVSASLPSMPETGGISGLEMDTLRKIMPLVSNFRKDSQDTVLLRAIRPYLQEERQKRLDDSIKIMQMLKLLPNLKDKGIF